MIAFDVIAIIAQIIQINSIDIVSILIGRLLIGIYCGVVCGIIPVYLISISPPQISGIIGSFNQLWITIGIAFAYYMGGILDTLAFWFFEN